MPAPLVSVILPVYNREALIARAIESVLAQTYGPLELLVVDDGSTDGTAPRSNPSAIRSPSSSNRTPARMSRGTLPCAMRAASSPLSSTPTTSGFPRS